MTGSRASDALLSGFVADPLLISGMLTALFRVPRALLLIVA